MENIHLEQEDNNSINVIDFLKWCNTPVYRGNGLGFRLRVQPQFPEYNSYIIIDETGHSVLPRGKFLLAEELYVYYKNNINKYI